MASSRALWCCAAILLAIQAHAHCGMRVSSITVSPKRYAAGTTVLITYTVTNNGRAPQSDVKVMGSVAVQGSGAVGVLTSCTLNPSTLPVGASGTCTATYGPTTQQQVDACELLQHTVSATGLCTPDVAPARLYTTAQRVTYLQPDDGTAFLLTLTPPASYLSAPDDVTFTYTITNVGITTVNSYSITSSLGTNSGCSITGPAVQGSVSTCTGTYSVTAADIAAGNPIINTVTAKATSTCGSRESVRKAVIYTNDKPQYTTQTSCDWSSDCNDNNQGCYRDANFGSCFPKGIALGTGVTVSIATGNDAKCFLAGLSNAVPAPLTTPFTLNTCAASCGCTAPYNAGTLAAQLLTAKMNVGFDACDPNFSPSTFPSSGAVLVPGCNGCNSCIDLTNNLACTAGQTVATIISNADKCLGDPTCTLAASFTACLDAFNNCFEAGKTSCPNFV